jgi:hypothetical protein
MKIVHDHPETLRVTIEITQSEAAALSDLLTNGYDQKLLGHNWDNLTVLLDSFCEETVLDCPKNRYPFTPVKTNWATEARRKEDLSGSTKVS